MSNQKVFRLPSKGAGIDALKEVSEPIPKARAYEVVLKVQATALNFRDYAISTGAYPFQVKDNLVPISDAAGIIHSVGEGVPNLKEGDWAISNFDISNHYGPQQNWENGLGGPIDGVLREYVAIPAAAIVKIPRSTTLSWEQLAALVCTGTTCWNTLFGNIPLKPGQTVLALGTGGVSMTGIMLAKAAGATTIITSSSDEKLKLAEADYAINYKKTPNWSEEVLRLTSGRGVDFIFENGGAGTIEQSLSCIAPGGQIGVIGFLSQPEKMPDVTGLVLAKGAVMRGIQVGAKQLAEEMVRFVCEKNLGVRIEKTFFFEREEVIGAFRELEKAGHVGKIAIRVAKD